MTPLKAHGQSNPAWVVPAHVSWQSPLRRFRGRSGPPQQWCTAGRNMESGPSVRSSVQEGSCAEDSLCSTVRGQRKKGKEVMWSTCPPSPLLYYEIWSDSSHFNASSGMQYSNTVITVLYKFEVLYLHIFILYYFVQIRDKSKIQTNRPSLIFSLNYTVWMCWIFPFCLCKAGTVMQQAWTHYYTAPLVTSLWYSLTTPFLLWNTCWQYGNADITDACAHCFIYQEWPQCHWNE